MFSEILDLLTQRFNRSDNYETVLSERCFRDNRGKII
jgi:hypothetical protein